MHGWLKLESVGSLGTTINMLAYKGIILLRYSIHTTIHNTSYQKILVINFPFKYNYYNFFSFCPVKAHSSPVVSFCADLVYPKK